VGGWVGVYTFYKRKIVFGGSLKKKIAFEVCVLEKRPVLM